MDSAWPGNCIKLSTNPVKLIQLTFKQNNKMTKAIMTIFFIY